MALDDTVVQPARSHDRFPCFDGVRALAAVMVVVYHSVFFNADFSTRGGSFLGTLNAGVWIFFVTSGCLLYLPFAASHLSGAPAVDPRGYAVRRLARVYPAYWLVLAFFTFVVPRINIYGLHGFLLHTTLTQTYVHINPFVDGLPPAWSLVVEISFYAFLPFYAALIGGLVRTWRPLTVELTGLAVLFAIGAGRDRRLWATGSTRRGSRSCPSTSARSRSACCWPCSAANRGATTRPPGSHASGGRHGSGGRPRSRRSFAIPVGLRLDPLAAPTRGAGDRTQPVPDDRRNLRRRAGRARTAGSRCDPHGFCGRGPRCTSGW